MARYLFRISCVCRILYYTTALKTTGSESSSNLGVFFSPAVLGSSTSSMVKFHFFRRLLRVWLWRTWAFSGLNYFFHPIIFGFTCTVIIFFISGGSSKTSASPSPPKSLAPSSKLDPSIELRALYLACKHVSYLIKGSSFSSFGGWLCPIFISCVVVFIVGDRSRSESLRFFFSSKWTFRSLRSRRGSTTIFSSFTCTKGWVCLSYFETGLMAAFSTEGNMSRLKVFWITLWGSFGVETTSSSLFLGINGGSRFLLRFSYLLVIISYFSFSLLTSATLKSNLHVGFFTNLQLLSTSFIVVFNSLKSDLLLASANI